MTFELRGHTLFLIYSKYVRKPRNAADSGAAHLATHKRCWTRTSTTCLDSYTRLWAADQPQVTEFVRFFVNEASKAVKSAGYVALPERGYELVLSRFEHRVLDSLFHGRGSTIGVEAADLTVDK
jgi:hypothetical protein